MSFVSSFNSQLSAFNFTFLYAGLRHFCLFWAWSAQLRYVNLNPLFVVRRILSTEFWFLNFPTGDMEIMLKKTTRKFKRFHFLLCRGIRHATGMKRWTSNCLSIIRLWRLKLLLIERNPFPLLMVVTIGEVVISKTVSLSFWIRLEPIEIE